MIYGDLSCTLQRTGERLGMDIFFSTSNKKTSGLLCLGPDYAANEGPPIGFVQCWLDKKKNTIRIPEKGPSLFGALSHLLHQLRAGPKRNMEQCGGRGPEKA